MRRRPFAASLRCAALALWGTAALAQPPGWSCRTLDGNGQCLGLSTFTEAGGTRISGLRSNLEGRAGWSGLVIREYPDGTRRECQADAAGRCLGSTTHYTAGGRRETGTMTVRAGVSVWNGQQTTEFANGDRLECRVAPEGLCEGRATLYRADGGRVEGELAPRGRGHGWVGTIRRSFANGDREECAADPAGRCRGPTTYTYADGTRLIGQRTIVGERSTWSGGVEQVFPSGKRMRCAAAEGSLCEEDTQIPVDREGRPLAPLPR